MNAGQWLTQSRGACALLFWCVPALAQTAPAPDCPGERYLVLHQQPANNAELAQEIKVDLSAELASRSIAVCEQEQPRGAPLALVTLRSEGDLVSIEVDDRTTQKRVSRDLHVDTIPQSGRALATAIAIDELLRASWAELALFARTPPAPAPVAPPPPPPQKPAAPPKPTAPAARKLGLSVSLGFAHARESWDAFSTNLRASFWPWPWAWVELGASLQGALDVESSLGRISGRAAGADVTLGLCPARTKRFFGCGGIRSGVDFVAYQAHAGAGASADAGSGTAVRMEGVGMLGLYFSRHWFVMTQLALGYPLQSVVAADAHGPVMGASSVLVSGALGVGVAR
jgi:hypothetical protein